jgi:hypothetical protein
VRISQFDLHPLALSLPHHTTPALDGARAIY